MPTHTHTNEDEGFYVLDGEFQVKIGNNQDLKIGPGEHAFGPRYVPHSLTNVGQKPGHLLLFFVPSGIEKYFKDLDKVRIEGGSNLLQQEEVIDKKYGITIDRR